jgi:predicted amidophosphoribosyltransferase
VDDKTRQSQSDSPDSSRTDRCAFCNSDAQFDNIRDIIYCEVCGAHLVHTGWMRRR